MPRDPAAQPIDDRIRAQHMLDAARQAQGFIAGRSRPDLDADPMLIRALLHAIQEIGEAASRITQLGRDRLPGVPWTQIVGMRHRLVHGYWQVDADLVWTVATRDLAPLIAALDAAFASWPLPEMPKG
jgi:uncharacterized protein with HEPN domain